MVLVEAEQDVDPGRLDVGVDHPHPHALGGQHRGHVGGGVRLSGPAPEGVDGDQDGHASSGV